MNRPRAKRAEPQLPPKLAEIAEFRYQLRKFLNFSETASEEAGISAQQYQLLQAVAVVPAGQECSISYLAERMVVRHNTAVELVDRAERSGLVERVADESDHRRSLVRITDKGGEMISRLIGPHLAEIEANGPDLIRTLQRLLGDRAAMAARKNGER